MYSTLQYLKKLKQLWRGSRVKVEQSEGNARDVVVIKALHIVFPWTLITMKYLAKTVFCDATFHVTIYEYKVVCLTTLDGNHHHRPLMMSFITSSTTEQWQTIFDLFYRHVRLFGIGRCHFGSHDTLSHNRMPLACSVVHKDAEPEELYAITSDQEKAISSGLAKSSMKNTAVHICCGLHAKWSKYGIGDVIG